LTSAQAERLWETWNLGGQFFGRRLFDDALPTLQWLKGRGVRLAIVTNRAFGGSHFQQELAACGLADLFDGIAVSCTVGYMKPHPEIFRAALAQIHAAPERAAHVGDSLVADVAGAQALGITAIWKRGRLNETANGIRPDFTIERLAELQTLDIWQGAG
jgi:putative hydrolase of the HAD superfamily